MQRVKHFPMQRIKHFITPISCVCCSFCLILSPFRTGARGEWEPAGVSGTASWGKWILSRDLKGGWDKLPRGGRGKNSGNPE